MLKGTTTPLLALTTLLLLILIFISTPAAAKSFWIDAVSGSDAEGCGAESRTPCETLNGAARELAQSPERVNRLIFSSLAPNVVNTNSSEPLVLRAMDGLTLESAEGAEAKADVQITKANLQIETDPSGTDDGVPVLLRDLRISGGSGTSGGCLFIDAASGRMEVELRNTKWAVCQASEWGGCVAMLGAPPTELHPEPGSLTVIDSSFRGCSSGYPGGAIRTFWPSLTLTRSKITQCSAGPAYAGGAVSVANAPLVLDSCSLTNNTSGDNGAAVTMYLEQTPNFGLTLANSTHIQDNAGWNGAHGAGVAFDTQSDHGGYRRVIVSDGSARIRSNGGREVIYGLSPDRQDILDSIPCSGCGWAGTYCALNQAYAFSPVAAQEPTLWSGCISCSPRFGRTVNDQGVCVCMDDHPECKDCSEGIYLAQEGGGGVCHRDVYLDAELGDDQNWPCLNASAPCRNWDVVIQSGLSGGIVNPIVHFGPGSYSPPPKSSAWPIWYSMVLHGAGPDLTTLQLGSHKWTSADTHMHVLTHGATKEASPLTFNLTDVTLTGGTSAQSAGGCLSIDAGHDVVVGLQRTVVDTCVSGVSGGGIGVGGNPATFGGVVISAVDSVVQNCSAAENGGGVYSPKGNVIWKRGAIIDNSAGHGGGGAHLQSAEIDGTVLTRNQAGLNGGGGLMISSPYDAAMKPVVYGNKAPSSPQYNYAPSQNVFCAGPRYERCQPCGRCERTTEHPHAQCALPSSVLAGVAGIHGCIECEPEFGQEWDDDAQECVCRSDHQGCSSCTSGVYSMSLQACVDTLYVSTTGDDSANWPCLDPESPCRTLGAALLVVEDGKEPMTIVLSEGSHELPTDDETPFEWITYGSMTLQGQGKGVTVLDLQQKHIVAGPGSLVIQDMSVTNGRATLEEGSLASSGGCIVMEPKRLEAVALTLKNAEVHDCQAVGRGGCLAGLGLQTMGWIVIQDSEVYDCVSGKDGGAIYASSHVGVRLDGATIHSSSSAASGGGISAQDKLVMANRAAIYNNTAQWGGGASIGGSMEEASGGYIYNNTALDTEANSANVECLNGATGRCVTCGTCSSHQDAFCTLAGYGTSSVAGPFGCSICDAALGQRRTPDGNCVCLSDHPDCNSCGSRNGLGGVYDIGTKSCVGQLHVASAGAGTWPCAAKDAPCSNLDDVWTTLMHSPGRTSEGWSVVVASGDGSVVAGRNGPFPVVAGMGDVRILGMTEGGSRIDLSNSAFFLLNPNTLFRMALLEVSNGFNPKDGGCIHSSFGSALELSRITVQGCVSGDDGGALFVGGVASLDSVLIAHCSVGGDGGAVAVGGEGILYMSGGGVQNNTAVRSGGAAYVVGTGMLSLSGTVCVTDNAPDGIVCDGYYGPHDDEAYVCDLSLDWNATSTIGRNGASGASSLRCLMDHEEDVRKAQRSCLGLDSHVPICAGKAMPDDDCASTLEWDSASGMCAYPVKPKGPVAAGIIVAVIGVFCFFGTVGWGRYTEEKRNMQIGGGHGSVRREKRRKGGLADTDSQSQFMKLVDEDEHDQDQEVEVEHKEL